MNEFDEQARQFLTDTNTSLETKFLYTRKYFEGEEEEERDVYSFVLQNAEGVYASKFGDSILNTKDRAFLSDPFLILKEDCDKVARLLNIPQAMVNNHQNLTNRKLKKVVENWGPGSYDILATIGAQYPDTFAEFCAEYGYDDLPLVEHDRINRIFDACKKEEQGLREIFTAEELERLSEIN